MLELLEGLAYLGLFIAEGADFLSPDEPRHGRDPRECESSVEYVLMSLGLAAVVMVVGIILVLVILWNEGVVQL